ncbi:MAG: tetratricopeptide repeat protein, partial [Saprospiraceae bacterium]|nr:tetratricopeptide repeat protein [Saprospiraceae bacterium]
YSNLATVLQDLGDYAKAKGLLEKALESAVRNFGPMHPKIALDYSNLALVMKDLGEFQDAFILISKSRAIFEQALPEGHPYIVRVKYNYENIKKHIT